MSKKILLLNSSYEALSFISERRALKLYLNEKVEIISSWEERVKIYNTHISIPAVLKLKRYIRKNVRQLTYCRMAVIKRDNSTCLYCGKVLHVKEATVDHIVPKCQGGKNSFMNCVTACNGCNNKKANKTPEQCGMKLLREPFVPIYGSISNYADDGHWHKDWDTYLKKV